MNKTYLPKEKDFDRKTYLINATDKTLGRLAVFAAKLLIGKSKSVFAYDQISGDQVVVVNASKIRVTGAKLKQKTYNHYSGYPGGLKVYSLEKLMSKEPEEIIRRAVFRMLPKNRLGREMRRRLRVYAGNEHPHMAQKPVSIEVK